MHTARICLEQETLLDLLYGAVVLQNIARPHYMNFRSFKGIKSLATSDILTFADNIWNSYLLEGIIKLS